jgi:hypothetical protein
MITVKLDLSKGTEMEAKLEVEEQYLLRRNKDMLGMLGEAWHRLQTIVVLVMRPPQGLSALGKGKPCLGLDSMSEKHAGLRDAVDRSQEPVSAILTELDAVIGGMAESFKASAALTECSPISKL